MAGAISGAMGTPTPYIAYSPSTAPSAPAPDGAVPAAPPRWRSATISSGLPEDGPAVSTSASTASSVSSRSTVWLVMPGVGCSGSP